MAFVVVNFHSGLRARLGGEMRADVLHVQQPAIAKMEKRTNMYVSTLRSHFSEIETLR